MGLGKNITFGPTPGNWGIQYVNFAMSSALHKVGMIFQAPKTGDIDRVSFRTSTVTVTDTLRATIQTLSGGDPSGTPVGTAGTQATPASNTTYEVTLGSVAAVTLGTWYAAVVEFDSFVAGNLNIAASNVGATLGSCYLSHFTAAWVKSTARRPIFSIRYSDGTYANAGQLPASAITTATYNSGSTPDERGNRIVLDKATTVVGLYALIDVDAACELVLYDSGGTAVITCTLDTTNRASNLGWWTQSPCAETVLAAGTYYLTIKPTSGSSVSAYYHTALSSSHLQPLEFTNMQMATRTNAGSWTLDDTSITLCGLVVSEYGSSVGYVPCDVQGLTGIRSF